MQENTNPLVSLSLVSLSSLGFVLNAEPLAPGRQGKRLPAELMLVSWACLLAAFSSKQDGFSKLVIPLLVFLVERESWAGGVGQGLCAQEQQQEQHLCSCKNSTAGLPPPPFRGAPLSHWHRAAVGTQLVSFNFKASVQTARENRICSRYCVKTLPGSAQAVGI